MSTILITGASRGIGKAIALKAAISGKYNKCIITGYKHEEALLEVQKGVMELQSYGDDFQCLPFIGNAGDISFIQRIYKEAGSVDVLINNAAISYTGLLIDMSPDQWHNIISTNISSVYNTCHTFLPDMIKRKKGKIINISSVWGQRGASCEVAYSATKGAINSFTKALAKELAPSNIQVNAIAYGMVDTEMNSHLSPEDIEDIKNDIPAGYILSCDEAAEAVIKALDMPNYMNGQIITLDGGWM